jgi:hypothetical protein
MSQEKKTQGNNGGPRTSKRELSNLDIVTVAVYLLGGDSHYIHTEDIAVKANELAPGRFTWVKYPEHINIHTVMTHLWDAKSARKGELVLGTEKEGWMLSTSGLKLARSRLRAVKGVSTSKKRLTAAERQWRRSERVRLLNSEAYEKVRKGDEHAVTLDEAEGFFRLNAYVVGEARDRKITRLVNMFGDDKELGQAVRRLSEKVRGE